MKEKGMVICDHCRDITKPAKTVHLLFGFWKPPDPPKTVMRSTSVLLATESRSTLPSEFDLCDGCADQMKEELKTTLEKFKHWRAE